MRPCQNPRRGRDNLDGQGLRLFRLTTISCVLLPAANLHHKDKHSGHLLLHGQLLSHVWMESQLDGGDARSESSLHKCIVMISNIAVIDPTYRTHAKKNKFYDFVLRLGGSSAKADKSKFWYHSQMALKELEESRLKGQYIKQWEHFCNAKSCLNWNNLTKSISVKHFVLQWNHKEKIKFPYTHRRSIYA